MSIVTAAFADGDFVVRNGTFVLVRDGEAIRQNTDLGLRLQLGLNQYFTNAGWDWMRFQNAPLTDEDVDEIISQIRTLCESQSDVLSASVTYLGHQEDEASFDIVMDTAYGTVQLPYSLGGALVYRGS